MQGGPPGDLYIIIKVAPHPFFDRRGDDLYTVVPITVSEASLGAKVEVPTIDGRAQVRIPPGTNSGKKLRLRKRARPRRARRASAATRLSKCRLWCRSRKTSAYAPFEGTRQNRPRRPAPGYFRARNGLRTGKETTMATRPRKKAKAGYMISAVAELYQLHPQTLRSLRAGRAAETFALAGQHAPLYRRGSRAP